MISNGFGGTLFSDKRIRHTFQRVDGWGLNHRGQLTADCRLHKRCMGARHAHVSCLVFFGLTWRKISVKHVRYTRNKHISTFNIFMRVKHRRLAMGESCTIFVGFSPMACFSWRSANISRGPAVSTCHSQKKQGMPGMHTLGQWQECLRYVLGVVLCCNQKDQTMKTHWGSPDELITSSAIHCQHNA